MFGLWLVHKAAFRSIVRSYKLRRKQVVTQWEKPNSCLTEKLAFPINNVAHETLFPPIFISNVDHNQLASRIVTLTFLTKKCEQRIHVLRTKGTPLPSFPL